MFLFYVTFPTLEMAQSMARTSVIKDYAKCAHILSPITACYMWGEDDAEPKMCEDVEYPVLFKVCSQKKDAFETWARKHHPYDTPAIIHMSVSANPEFLNWMNAPHFKEMKDN